MNEEKFWSNVEKTDTCWFWKAGTSKQGYGQFSVNLKQKYTHRISWEIAYGDIPRGQEVLHTCDNPSCVRPEHLFLGTQNDNMQDCIRKGRHVDPPHFSGEDHPSSKLTLEQVREIRSNVGNNTQAELARKFGITRMAIWNIQNGLSWKETK